MRRVVRRARPGDYRQGATAAGDPGVRSPYRGGGLEGPKEKPPPPRCSQVPHPVLASCLRRACDMCATKGRRQGRPPPHTPPPPRGCARKVGGATTGDSRQAPPPVEGQVPRLVPAPCLRRACDVRATKGRRQGRPPPPPTPPPPRGWGMQVGGGEKRPPPRGQSGRVGRQRREGAGRTTRPCPKRARAVQAPAGGPPGVRTQGRKGDDGSHTACPPPCRGTGAAPHACAVLASCLRHACNEGKTTSPPPPPHTPPPPQGWGVKVGRGGQRPPPPRTKRQGGEAAERGCGTDHTTVPVGSTRRASPNGGGTGGANAG